MEQPGVRIWRLFLVYRRFQVVVLLVFNSFLGLRIFMCSPFVLVPVFMYSKQNWISKSPIYERSGHSLRKIVFFLLSSKKSIVRMRERDSRHRLELLFLWWGVLLLLFANAMRLAGVRTNIDRYRKVCRVLYGKRSNLTSRIFNHRQ